MLLQMDHVTMEFGGLKAVDDFSLQLDQGELVGLIGPNGAGKTTVFNVITGVYTPQKGRIILNVDNSPRDITGMRPDLITHLGIARTFQNIRLFPQMSVLDNILVSFHWHHKANLFHVLAHTKKYQREEEQMVEMAMTFLKQVNLDHLAHAPASSLPYGSQRRLEIARALATKPKLLLLDEPAAGMNPAESLDLMAFIKRIRQDFRLTILLIEHQMRVVMGISERIVVMDHGVIISRGTPSEVAKDPKVVEAYLGTEEQTA